MKILRRGREAFSALGPSIPDSSLHQKTHLLRLPDARALFLLLIILILALSLSARELYTAVLVNKAAISFVRLEAASSDRKNEETLISDISGLFGQSDLVISPRLIWYQGLIDLLVLRNPAAAKQHFELYMRGGHDDGITRFWQAETYQQLGDHAQAILWWRKAGAGLRFYEYGYSLEQSGDLADAETVYLTATEIDPSLAAAYIGLARISEIQRRWDDAVRYYREAIRLHPQQGSLYYSLGNILVQELQEPAKAISVFEEGVDSDATYLWNYIGLERGYRSINDFENALYWLNRAALTSPDSAFPQIDYGYFYLNLGDWNKALVYFRQAIKIDPSQRGSYYQIARILRQHGELEAAIDFYLSAIRISPDFVPALMELADTYLEMGRTADACEYYGFVIGLAPSNSSARSQYRSRGCGK